MSTHVDGAAPSVAPDPDDREPGEVASPGPDAGSEWVRAEMVRRMESNRSTRGRHARRNEPPAPARRDVDGPEAPRRRERRPVAPQPSVAGPVSPADLPENYVPRHSQHIPGPAAEPAAPISGPIPIVRPSADGGPVVNGQPVVTPGALGGPSLPPTGLPVRRQRGGGPGTPLQADDASATGAWARPEPIVPVAPARRLGAPPEVLGGPEPVPSWGLPPLSPPRGFAGPVRPGAEPADGPETADAEISAVDAAPVGPDAAPAPTPSAAGTDGDVRDAVEAGEGGPSEVAGEVATDDGRGPGPTPGHAAHAAPEVTAPAGRDATDDAAPAERSAPGPGDSRASGATAHAQSAAPVAPAPTEGATRGADRTAVAGPDRTESGGPDGTAPPGSGATTSAGPAGTASTGSHVAAPAGSHVGVIAGPDGTTPPRPHGPTTAGRRAGAPMTSIAAALRGAARARSGRAALANDAALANSTAPANDAVANGTAPGHTITTVAADAAPTTTGADPAIAAAPATAALATAPGPTAGAALSPTAAAATATAVAAPAPPVVAAPQADTTAAPEAAATAAPATAVPDAADTAVPDAAAPDTATPPGTPAETATETTDEIAGGLADPPTAPHPIVLARRAALSGRRVGVPSQRTPDQARAVTPRPAAPRHVPVVGTAPPEPGSTRVRVVLSERKGVARPVRTIKEVQEGTAVGELLRRDLIRSQLFVTLRFAALTLLVLGALPAVFALLPAVSRFHVLGVRLPWLVLGLLMYPFLVGVAWWYTRVADRVEQNFADHVQD